MVVLLSGNKTGGEQLASNIWKLHWVHRTSCHYRTICGRKTSTYTGYWIRWSSLQLVLGLMQRPWSLSQDHLALPNLDSIDRKQDIKTSGNKSCTLTPTRNSNYKTPLLSPKTQGKIVTRERATHPAFSDGKQFATNIFVLYSFNSPVWWRIVECLVWIKLHIYKLNSSETRSNYHTEFC